MFNKNDKSFNIIRKITNVTLFVLMCAAFIAGIVMIAISFESQTKINYGVTYSTTVINYGTLIGGIATMLLGPIFLQLVWLVTDMKFNAMFDVKAIRNAQYGLQAPEIPGPLFFSKKKDKNLEFDTFDIYEQLKEYKVLCDEAVITENEYEEIKSKFLNKNADNNRIFECDIDKIKRLKQFADDKILTEEEFLTEKNKIIKK